MPDRVRVAVVGCGLIAQVMRAYTDWESLLEDQLEQDGLPDPRNPGQPARGQRRNREYLRAHGL